MIVDALPNLGSFQTRSYTLAAGARLAIDADVDQVVVTELDGADTIALRANHGPEGEAFKGLELRGPIRHLDFTNTAADAVTLKLATVKGLQLTDRRLNQVGDLGLVTTYAVFQPIGTTTIPAQSVREVAAADADRRFVVLTNPPGQFREIYISGSEFTLPDGGLVNGGFETGDKSSWTVANGTWNVLAAAARTGAFGVQIPSTGVERILRQSIDLLLAGFDADDIDAGGLVVDAEMYFRLNGGSGGPGAGRLLVEFRDAGDVLISSLDSGNSTPTAGVWTQQAVDGAIPTLTRHVRFELRGTAPSNGTDFDDAAMTIDGAPAQADELAGMVMPAQMIQLASSGAIHAYNPHTSDQDLIVGEIKAS